MVSILRMRALTETAIKGAAVVNLDRPVHNALGNETWTWWIGIAAQCVSTFNGYCLRRISSCPALSPRVSLDGKVVPEKVPTTDETRVKVEPGICQQGADCA